MYVNGKMIPVELLQEWGAGEIKEHNGRQG
jgi:hypothetical protein